MYVVECYAFDSALSLDEMLERLNAPGRHGWIEGDSAWYPEYIKLWTYRPVWRKRYRLRIYRFAKDVPPFVLELKCGTGVPDAEASWQEFWGYVSQEVFPAVGARDIVPTECFD